MACFQQFQHILNFCSKLLCCQNFIIQNDRSPSDSSAPSASSASYHLFTERWTPEKTDATHSQQFTPSKIWKTTLDSENLCESLINDHDAIHDAIQKTQS